MFYFYNQRSENRSEPLSIMEVILQHTGALMTCLIAVTDAPAKPSLLGQVGGMLLHSVPTALLFLVLVVAYEFLVHKPLTATLARRRA